MNRKVFIPIVLLGIALGVSAGCERTQPIESYKAPKEPPVVITWKKPGTWREALPETLQRGQYTAYQVAPRSQVTVTPLPPSPVAANVIRWEGQLGLKPSPEAVAATKAKQMQTLAGPADVVDLVGSEDEGVPMRIVAAMIPHAGEMWFFKLSGPANEVEEEKADFLALVKSVRFPIDAVPNPATPSPADRKSADPSEARASSPLLPVGPTGARVNPSAEPAGGPEKITKFKIPPGWEQQGRRPMREVTFQVGSGTELAEAWISQMPGSAGGLLANVNRWRGSVGLPPTTADQIDERALERVTIAGSEAMLFDFRSPEGRPPQRLLAVWLNRNGTSWFFRISGDPKTVEANEAAFRQFLASMEFGT